MPVATDALRTEHETILKMLNAIEEVAWRLDRGDSVAPEMLFEFVDFFRLFTDRCHHGKEEDLLFPLLASKGVPQHGGCIGAMLAEHEESRKLMTEMSMAAQGYAGADPNAAARWAVAARRYADLLGRHIDKENKVMFALADRLLSEAEQIGLAAQFQAAEPEKIGAGERDRLDHCVARLLAEITEKGESNFR